jgi:hypothetical protein
MTAATIEARPVTPPPLRSSPTVELTPPVQRRWHARVISAVYTSDGWVRAFTVRCPFCRGQHQHSAWGSTHLAQPHCGTPGVYEVIWPETTEPAEQPDDPDESSNR